MTIPNPTNPIIPAPKPTAAQSERLNELNSQEISSKNDLIVFSKRESYWHDAYLFAALFTAILAVLSLVFQGLETRNIKRERSTSETLSAIHGERRAIEKAVSDSAIVGALERAEMARATAESEKLERRKLELLVSPRRLTIEQQVKIGQACKAEPGLRVWLISYSLDVEASVLVEQIAESLKSGKITVLDPITTGAVGTGSLEQGINVLVPPDRLTFAACFIKALHAIGNLQASFNAPSHIDPMNLAAIELSNGPNPAKAVSLPKGSPVVVIVGVKPPEILPPK